MFSKKKKDVTIQENKSETKQKGLRGGGGRSKSPIRERSGGGGKSGNGNGGIQFHSRASLEQVHRISRVSQSYTPEEVIAVWGDSTEFKLRKQELKHAVHAMQTGRRSSDNYTFSKVGLEDKIGEGRRFKKQLRSSGWQAVLEEQFNQEVDGMYDPEAVADAYSATTVEATQKALEAGMKMRQEVDQLLVVTVAEGGGGKEKVEQVGPK
jgi:hypothetical protein